MNMRDSSADPRASLPRFAIRWSYNGATPSVAWETMRNQAVERRLEYIIGRREFSAK